MVDYKKSVKDSITPDFVSREDEREAAKNTLKNQETSAASPLYKTAGDAKSRETIPKSLYDGKARKYNPKQKSKKGQKKRGPFKKKVPAIILTLFLCVAGATIFSSNSLLGPHLSALYTEATDTQHASSVLRGRRLKVNQKYGRASGFYDKTAGKIYQKLGISRNIFKDYKETGDTDTDNENYRETRKAVFDGETDSKVNTAEDRVVTDEDGNEHVERVPTGEDVDTRNVAGDTAETKARSYIASISSRVGNVTNTGCAILKVGSLVSVAVAGYELYSSMHYALNNMESVSKMMDGKGTESGINETLNFFSEPKKATITDPETGEEIVTNGSPLQAEGNRKILGQVAPNQQKSKNYSLERLLTSAVGAAAFTGATFKSCNMIRAANALVSLVALATPGGGLIRSAVGMLLETAIGAGAELAITGVLAFMIPHVAQALFTNTFESTAGIPAGETVVRGMSAANTRVGRSGSGQSPSSAEAALAYNQVNEEVIALEAAEDRKNRSPFDLTSKNTFLGSLARKFMILNYSSGISGVFNTFSNIAKNSLPHIATAEGEGETYMTTFGEDCPNLEAIGAKGDIYCNPITTTDLSTIDLDENDPTYLSVINPNLEKDENGKDKIKNDSELGKYIKYCTERDSPFGVQDAGIASDLETSLGAVGDNIPLIGDVVDIVNSIEAEGGSGWVDGSWCVNSSKNERWNKEMKYYQRYIEDNRIISREEGTEDPVSAFKDAYYAEHPLDNSRAGYLARVSGLSKDDASTALAVIDYYNFLDDYDPSIAYNFVKKSENKKVSINSDNNYKDYYIFYKNNVAHGRREELIG